MERLTEKFVCNLPNEVLLKLGIADVPREDYEIKEVFGSTCKEVCEEHECSNCPIQKVISKLADYEDAEEQGLLLRLPCKVGSTVYVIGSLSEFGVTEEIELKVFECMVNKITLNHKYGNTMQMDCKEHSSFGWSMNMKKINELVFLTKEEAAQALKDMKGDSNEQTANLWHLEQS